MIVQNKTKVTILIAIGSLLLGAVIGSFAGELIKAAIPNGIVKEVFLRSIDISMGPAALDLIMFTITLGISFKINLIGIVGIGAAYYLLRFWR